MSVRSGTLSGIVVLRQRVSGSFLRRCGVGAGRAVGLILLVVIGVSGCSTEPADGAGEARPSGVSGAAAPDSTALNPAAPAAGSSGSQASGSGGGGSDAEPDAAPADEGPGTGGVTGAEWTAGDTSEQRAVEGAALLRALRTARHDGFDRIVLDFGSDPVPSYRIRYIDRPVRECGSGNAVELAGDGWLSITVEPANAHTEAGAATVTPRHREPQLPVLLELRIVCDFEAQVEVVAGVASPERYRAFVLKEPNRLVVDVQH